jgi:lysophospholipase L1-like esterase
MDRLFAVAVACAAVMAAACGDSPSSLSPVSASRVARLSRTHFLAFGDSFTSGEITAPIAVGGSIHGLAIVPGRSYPEVLQGELAAAYPVQAPLITVANMGKGAETLYDGVIRFAEVLPSSDADVVLLQEGVNGLGFEGPDGSTTLLRQMVDRARDAGAQVFVGSMIPTLPGRQRSQNAAALVAYDDALRAMCTQEGVTYVDLYDAILPQADQLIGIDGLHPNEAGYRKIADLFFAAIQGDLEER